MPLKGEMQCTAISCQIVGNEWFERENIKLGNLRCIVLSAFHIKSIPQQELRVLLRNS